MSRLTFGQDVPCPQCKLTGQVPAHAMTKAERSYRSRENQRRITLKLPALPKPDTTQDCPRCHGKGTIPASSEVTGRVTLTVPNE